MIKKRLCWRISLFIFIAYAEIAFGGNNYFGITSPFADRSTTSGDSTLRCGRRLVSIGDHKNNVYDLCGEPESIDRRTKLVGKILHHPRRTLDIEEYEEIQVEEWVYNFGPNRFRKYLRFENGRLVEIATLGRSK